MVSQALRIPAGPRAWEAKNITAHNNITHDNVSQGYSFQAAVDSRLYNSCAYRIGWSPVTANNNAVTQMSDGTYVPLLYSARDTVYNCSFDKASWFYADSLDTMAVTATNIVPLRMLTGDAGNNSCSGGFAIISSNAGRDTLNMVSGMGITEFTDFSLTNDVVTFAGYGFGSFADIMAVCTQVGPHAVFNLTDSSSLWIDNVNKSQFTATNFIIKTTSLIKRSGSLITEHREPRVTIGREVIKFTECNSYMSSIRIFNLRGMLLATVPIISSAAQWNPNASATHSGVYIAVFMSKDKREYSVSLRIP